MDDDDPVAPAVGAGLVDVLAPGQVPQGRRRVLEAAAMDGSPVALAHADHARLRRMAIFDAVANNADRKGCHVLRDAVGEVFGVDHGLTFNTDDKLRTVLWGWAGGRLTEPERDWLTVVFDALAGDGSLARELSPLLTEAEIETTRHRALRLPAAGRYPRPAPGFLAVPWPAF